MRVQLEGVQSAVAGGATLLQKDISGFTPLYRACAGKEASRVAVIDWILSRDEGRRTLEVAAKSGRTPLMSAAFHGNAAVVRCLLTNGAEMRGRDVQGSSAEDWARRFKYQDVVAVLTSAAVADAAAAEEWRPQRHAQYPPKCRLATCTLAMLAKARRSDAMRYPEACLGLLPEELLQALFGFLCCGSNVRAFLFEA